MKKVLITMAVLTSMVAGAMMFSSFCEPKQNVNKKLLEATVKDGWREIGVFIGTCPNCYYTAKFRIWETKDACGSYYWVLLDGDYDADEYRKNPDETRCAHGALRQRDGKWQAVVSGTIYTIRDF